MGKYYESDFILETPSFDGYVELYCPYPVCSWERIVPFDKMTIGGLYDLAVEHLEVEHEH